MSYLANLLDLFSPDLALTSEERVGFFERIRQNPDLRELEGLRRELTELYSNENTDWVALVTFDRDSDEPYVPFEGVYEIPDQGVARSLMTRWIWNVLFPAEADCPPCSS